MYKIYSPKDYIDIATQCEARLRKILQQEFSKMESLRESINDRYPFDDLHLRCAEVDYTESLIKDLLQSLAKSTVMLKKKIKEEK